MPCKSDRVADTLRADPAAEAATDPAPDDILDLPALRRNFAGEPEFLVRLLAKFEASYPAQVTLIREALARGDGDRAGGEAHRLAGAASVFYANAARRTALSLEELADGGDLPGAAAACESLARELDRLAAAVRAVAATL